MSYEDSVDIKSSIIILNNSMSQLSDSQTKLSNTMTEMLLEMRERDTRDEYLKEKVSEIDSRQREIIEKTMPIIERAKAGQDNIDKFKSALFSSWGKMASVGLVIIVAYILGVDISKWLKM